MGELASHAVHFLARAAAEQGGIISGDNPTKYNASNPIRLWVIQLVLIVGMTQLLALFLSRIRQPRVIAEVIGGIVLGPSVMGHIPNFRASIFPTESLPVLTITANIGLLLFLFLVGLEIDTRILKKNLLTAATVSFTGLIIPLGLGAALGVGVYHEFIPKTVNFGLFLLFVAVAIGITAFPVLCRILTELKLLDTEVGLITLAAGSIDDVVGWILLALTVALVNSSSGLTALYILLASAGYTILLLFPGRWAFRWFAKWTGSLEKGSPTAGMMTVTLISVFVSAFFTDIIGIHAIFGGFLVGLLVPHDNGLAISFVEKLEDLVTIVFLPIYFTLSGLRTDLSLLNSGVAWGYIVLICLVAFTSKFVGCSIAAHLNGFKWREAGAIGSLMSCKGLVELIVLNIGLQANILTPRAFSMFVVHALVLTFMTTPLVLLFYPAKYRVHLREDQKLLGVGKSLQSKSSPDEEHRNRFTILLDRIEALPAAMTLSQLLYRQRLSPPPGSFSSESDIDKKGRSPQNADSPADIQALRLMELTNRTSAVLRSQEADSLVHNDPVVSIYKTFGQLNHFNVSATLSVVNFTEFPEAIAEHVAATSSQMVIIPWARGITQVSDENAQGQQVSARNPFDGVFHKTTVQDQTGSVVYSEFIRNVFARTPSDIALFVDRGVANPSAEVTPQHIFLPFIGGPDDRLALSFVVQLCENPLITATVVRITRTGPSSGPTDEVKDTTSGPIAHANNAAADTVYAQGTITRLSSNTADSILWDRYTTSPPPNLAAALSRTTFRTESTATPLRRIAELAKKEVAATSGFSDKTLIVFTGRSRRLAVESLGQELASTVSALGISISTSVPKTLGDVGAALVASDVKASLLVLQAAPTGL